MPGGSPEELSEAAKTLQKLARVLRGDGDPSLFKSAPSRHSSSRLAPPQVFSRAASGTSMTPTASSRTMGEDDGSIASRLCAGPPPPPVPRPAGVSPLRLHDGMQRGGMSSEESRCSWPPSQHWAPAKEPFAPSGNAGDASCASSVRYHQTSQQMPEYSEVAEGASQRSWAKAVSSSAPPPPPPLEPPHRGLGSIEDGEAQAKSVPPVPHRKELFKATEEAPKVPPHSGARDGKSPFLEALEVLVGNRIAPESELERIRQPLGAMAEELDCYYQQIHGATTKPDDVVVVLAQTQSALRERDADLLHCDAELAKATTTLQRSQAQLSEVNIKLQEARKEIKQKDARLQRSEIDLTATRELLRRSRAETEKTIAEVMEIQSQLIPKQTSSPKSEEVPPSTGGTGTTTEKDNAKVKEQARHWQDEANKLRRELRQVQVTAEKDFEDYSSFLRQLASSSSGSVVSRNLNMEGATVMGMGTYGFVFVCEERDSAAKVVAKLQSQRWLDSAAREWAHAASLGSHPHIVAYRQIFLHRDDGCEVSGQLDAGFASGKLAGRKPRQYPANYVCITLEYMDRGTVQDLISRRLLTVESVAAIARQAADALAYIHEQQRTHNDLMPSNVLLQSSPVQGVLTVKLADFSLTEHTLARKRDCDLLAYLIWCMSLNENFTSFPEAADEQANAIGKMQAAGPSDSNSDKGLWATLLDVVDLLWKGEMTAGDAAQVQLFQGLEVRVQKSAEEGLGIAGMANVMPFVEAATSWQSKWRHGWQSQRVAISAARQRTADSGRSSDTLNSKQLCSATPSEDQELDFSLSHTF